MGTYLRVSLVLVFAFSSLSVFTALAEPIDSEPFQRTWSRTDQPVADGRVNRTWMWGPSGHTGAFMEPYADAPGGQRLVQYMDKSRMEDNSYRAERPWDVTNGLIAQELMTGEMQTGDQEFVLRTPASIQIAGDSHPDSPTYSTFGQLLGHPPLTTGSTIVQTIASDGVIGSSNALGGHHVVAANLVPETNHAVASVFWDFMNSSGEVYEGGNFFQAKLFENPFFATGFPITEAYWVNVPVAGVQQDVLVQCFQRRCLTFTPGNSDGWQVEAGNIGQHYYKWRYETIDVDDPESEYVYSVGADNTVRKIDSTGKQVWSFTGHTNWVYSVAVNPDGHIYSASQDGTVRKIDRNGKQVWAHLHAGDQAVYSVVISGDGSVYSATEFGEVRKIDAAGNLVWMETLSAGSSQDLAVDSIGHVYAVGSGVINKIDSSGKLIWSLAVHQADMRSVALGVDGSVYFGGPDNALLKFSPDGNQLWSFTGHSSAINGIAVDAAGNVYSVATDTTLRKIDSQGKEVWLRGFTDEWGHAVLGYGVSVDRNGDIFLASADQTLRKLDSDGDLIWEFSAHTGGVFATAVDPGTVGAFPNLWN